MPSIGNCRGTWAALSATCWLVKVKMTRDRIIVAKKTWISFKNCLDCATQWQVDGDWPSPSTLTLQSVRCRMSLPSASITRKNLPPPPPPPPPLCGLHFTPVRTALCSSFTFRTSRKQQWTIFSPHWPTDEFEWGADRGAVSKSGQVRRNRMHPEEHVEGGGGRICADNPRQYGACATMQLIIAKRKSGSGKKCGRNKNIQKQLRRMTMRCWWIYLDRRQMFTFNAILFILHKSPDRVADPQRRPDPLHGLLERRILLLDFSFSGFLRLFLERVDCVSSHLKIIFLKLSSSPFNIL